MYIILRSTFIAFCGLTAALCQQTPPPSGTAPVYRVTVVQRNVPAINYQYRSGPTKIDFRGTVLLNTAKGEATVESLRGRTEIDAKFERLAAPSRFGRQYLTYVLWALSPEGAPHNLGEVITNTSDSARLRVSTGLQVFGLIVTAEPYAAVRQPSDVVVMQNEIRPDTLGQAQPIQVNVELMSRGHYTWEVPENASPAEAAAPRVSMKEYEALLALYQAQNAVAIAGVAGAGQYAPDTFAKAQQLLEEARRLDAGKADRKRVVQTARAAVQTAEDARVIGERRKEEEKTALARKEAAAAERVKTQAEAEAGAQRAQGEAERSAHRQDEAPAAPPVENSAPAVEDRVPPPAPAPVQPPPPPLSQGSRLRRQLLQQLNGLVDTRDTPRGLVVTMPDQAFDGPAPRSAASEQLARLARIVAPHSGLRIEVLGSSDSASTGALWRQRATEVREVLVAHGLPPASTEARGLGTSRPLVSTATAAGRIENRRVEIVISGGPIGALPLWDRAYSVRPRSTP